MAFEPGHGRTAVPVRSALAGTMLAVAAVVGAVVFGGSFLRLVGTPHSYGQNWNQQLDLQVASAPASVGAGHGWPGPGLDQYAGGNYGQVSVAARRQRQRHDVPAIGIDQRHGTGFLTLLAGRAPPGPGRSPSARARCALHGLHVGQRVRVTANGQAIHDADRRLGGVPGVQRRRRRATDLGDGAAVSASLLSTPYPPTGACTGCDLL